MLAPHILVEDVTVANIELARKAYLETDLRSKLDDRTAVFMITNPNTLGLFDGQIVTITDLLHQQGPLHGDLRGRRAFGRVKHLDRIAVLRECGIEPGDIQLLNNHVTLHSRTEFEDWPEEDRKRHLLRMWLSMPNTRELSPLMGAIYQDQRGGTVRGGFPSRTGAHSFETVKAQD